MHLVLLVLASAPVDCGADLECWVRETRACGPATSTVTRTFGYDFSPRDKISTTTKTTVTPLRDGVCRVEVESSARPVRAKTSTDIKELAAGLNGWMGNQLVCAQTPERVAKLRADSDSRRDCYP